MLVFMLLWLAFVVFLIAAQWKVYEKAGQPGWAAIVPIYNIIVMLKIIGKPTWWLLLIIFPLTAPIFGIWALNMLSKSFGKDEGFTIGLLILGFIFYPVLGFGSAQYIGPYGDQQAFQAAQDPTFDFNGK